MSNSIKSILYSYGCTFATICTTELLLSLRAEQHFQHDLAMSRLEDQVLDAKLIGAVHYLTDGMPQQALVGPIRSETSTLMIQYSVLALLAAIVTVLCMIMAIRYHVLARDEVSADHAASEVEEPEFEEDPSNEGVLMYPE